MTRYTVAWVKSAQDELAELWLAAEDRAAVTAAADEIDDELSVEAQSRGVELSEGLRALFCAPLRVIFTVRENDRVAEVLRVRLL
jgi:hypothetical protein